jgi:hypothetical protein
MISLGAVDLAALIRLREALTMRLGPFQIPHQWVIRRVSSRKACMEDKAP